MKLKTIAATSGILLALAVAALAHSGAQGVVKERMEMMKDIASQMKALSQMIKGEREFDSDGVREAASVIADHARDIPMMFPEGSNEHPSEVADAVWERWSEFVALGELLGTRADALAEASESAGNATDVRPGFTEIGKTCLSCHQDFRVGG